MPIRRQLDDNVIPLVRKRQPSARSQSMNPAVRISLLRDELDGLLVLRYTISCCRRLILCIPFDVTATLLTHSHNLPLNSVSAFGCNLLGLPEEVGALISKATKPASGSHKTVISWKHSPLTR